MDNDSAIRDADVQVDTETNPAADAVVVDRPKSPRELAMDAIAESRRQSVSDELEQVGDAPLTANVADAPAAVSLADEIVKQVNDGPVALDGDLSKYRIRVKIDGEEMDVPLDQVTRNYQKGGAADKRLAEATRLMEEARAIQARPAAVAATAVADTQEAKPAGKSGDAARKYSSALFEGDEDKAASLFDEAVASRVQEEVQAAIERLGQGRGNATPTPELIAAVSHSVKQQVVVDSALAKSRSDYPALYADPDIEQLAAAKITRRVEEGIPFAEALESVGSEFAKTFKWQEPGRTQGQEANRERKTRLDRKAGIDNVPATNARSASTSAADEAPTDENQRAARGIAQIIAQRPGQPGG